MSDENERRLNYAGKGRMIAEQMILQAHAMSQAEAVQHVSDAAWEADARFFGVTREATEQWHVNRGTVLRTVAEWQAMEHKAYLLQQRKRMYTELAESIDDLRAQLAAKTAECERLRSVNASLSQQVTSAEIEIATMYERLRKGREDEKPCNGSHVVGETHSRCPAHPLSGSLVVVADTLDPRLGIQQPQGEPVQPMSLRLGRMSGIRQSHVISAAYHSGVDMEKK